jgi:hypothetical protein
MRVSEKLEQRSTEQRTTDNGQRTTDNNYLDNGFKRRASLITRTLEFVFCDTSDSYGLTDLLEVKFLLREAN